MSEEIRSRLYAWLCEQTDGPQAEYLMSCLAPAPLSDLVTKDFLSAEVAGLDAKIVGVELKIGQLVAQRAEDLGAARQRHWWLMGTFVSAALAIGVPVWLSTLGVTG